MLKPMLAADTDGTGLTYPLLVSPKLDGVRAMVVGGVLLSRSFKPIPNIDLQNMYGNKKWEGLDGELIAGDATDPMCFRNTMSAAMSECSKVETPIPMLHVFDDRTNAADPFVKRLERARMRVAGVGAYPGLGRFATFLTHTEINSHQALQMYEEGMLRHGYEGVMLRAPGAPYKGGRSTLKEGWLLKLKRFKDGEAVVLGVEEQMHNGNELKRGELGQAKRQTLKAGMVGKGTLGALRVRDLVSGVEFGIGTGFDDVTRQALWNTCESLPGQIVKYRYFPTGSKDKPRFPVFHGFRDRRDM